MVVERLGGRLATCVQGVAAVAAAELRSHRLVRTWLVVILAAVLVLGSHALVALPHARHWGGGLFADVYTPRFATSWLGAIWLWLYLVASVFLAFDGRFRDRRDRIVEVLDAKPISNLCLLGGRLAGLVLATWLALVTAIVLVQALGLVGEALQDASDGGEPMLLWLVSASIEPVSLAAFVLVDALPSLTLIVAVVLFLAATLRNRLLTVLVALALIGLHVALLGALPVYLLPAASLVSGHAEIGSDIVPRFADWQTILQRASVLVVAGGFLVLAAAAQARRDDQPPRRRVGLGAILLAIGGLGITAVAMDGANELRQRDHWLAIHEAVATDRLPDIEEITGTVGIEPGGRLSLDVEIRLTVPGRDLDRLVFSLNPGYDVHGVSVGGSSLAFNHEDGLLTLYPADALAAGSEVVLELQAEGVPDASFAYLDGAVDWRRLNSANPLLLLGTDSAIFESDYVALPSALHWLPGRGPNVETPTRGRDFYLVDLVVDVPDGWLVAGPGRRQEIPGASRFRFSPGAPLPGVALFAARFERRAVAVSGIEFELLVTPRHMRNVRLLAAAKEGLVDWFGERIEMAEQLGLAYPYGGFSVVEVPGRYRSYAGGWRLDTALFPPGLMLMREPGFPTARLEFMLHQRNFGDADEKTRKLRALRSVFARPHTGGNYHHAARNQGLLQVGGAGPGATVLEYVLRELVTRLVWRETLTVSGRAISLVDFSAHQLDRRTAWGVGLGPMVGRLLGGAYPDALQVSSNRPAVWEAAERTPLLEVADSGLDTRFAVDVLSLKGGAVAEAMIGMLGWDATARLVAELLDRHAGGTFDLDDLSVLGRELDTEIPSVALHWLTHPGLPGFLTSEVTVVRIADDDAGAPRYRLSLHIRNDEQTPGLAGLVFAQPAAYADPVHVPGKTTVEIARVFATPPREVWLRPYLSLNRNLARLTVTEVDHAPIAGAESFIGVRPSDWRPVTGAAIIVDDLDPGFSATTSVTGARWLGRRRAPDDALLDQGMLEYRVSARAWGRQELPTAYGKYRRTVARAWSGESEPRATFAATLPSGGRWRLDYHVPDFGRANPYVHIPFMDLLGDYDIALVDRSGTRMVTDFDGAQAAKGWHKLGEFELEAGEVAVEVSARGTGQVVAADAVRWTPADR